MQLLQRQKALRAAASVRRGAALLLSMLVLFVLWAIVIQIAVTTATDARIGRNDVALTTMDLAIESALLEISETLIADAEAGEDSGGGGMGDAFGDVGGDGGGFPGGEGGEEEGGGGPVDCKEDDWARPIRTEMVDIGIRLRVLVQDEDSKYNVLTMLSEDEEEAQKAYDRVVRILDLCREGTGADIDSGDAREMATQMLEYIQNRDDFFPTPTLLTADEEQEELALPLSLREFVYLPAFEPNHFRDFRDEDGEVVHSIGSYLTVWTALTTRDDLDQEAGGEDGEGDPPAGEPGGGTSTDTLGGGNDDVGDLTGTGAGGQGAGDESLGGGGGGGAQDEKAGIAVNINTAPLAVLVALMDDRDVSVRFWEDVLEWRNEPDEEALDEDEEPPLDEFGDEVIPKQYFESLGDLDEFDEYRNLEGTLQGELNQLLTTQSHVFSIYVTARKPTGLDAGTGDFAQTKEELLEEEEKGQALTRTVRCVVWRRQGQDGWELIPLERWEVCDYMPFEVLDFPDEDR